MLAINQAAAARRRRRRRVRPWMGAAAAALVAVTGLVGVNQRPAFGDASAPPKPNTACPPAQAPPPGYPNPPPPASRPYAYNGHNFSGPIPYEIPFKGTIGSASNAGATLSLKSTSPSQPNILVPHIYAAVCGVISLPSLVGSLPPGDVNLASNDSASGASLPNTANVYVGGVEAFPLYITFGNLTASVVKTPAANGGLDVTVNGSNMASFDATGTPNFPNTLGTNCPVAIPNVPLTTLTSGALSGQPVTGGFHSGVALAVADNFAIPAVQPSSSCPPALAQTVNKFVGLPARAGVASLTVPITFNFGLEQAPPYDKDLMCPCPP